VKKIPYGTFLRLLLVAVLEFQIIPNNINDDYDWAIYDLSLTDCSGIVNGTAPEVRCNYSAIPGSTGLSFPYTLTSVSAAGPNQCAPMNVVVGETYVLIINNHAGSTNGYTLDFGGTAVIYDNVPPEPVALDPFDCDPPTSLHLTLSEQVRCNTIAGNGSDLYITGPSIVTIASASSTNCGPGLFTNDIDIQLTAPITVNGNYILHFKDGVDGNVILDNCGNELSDTTEVPFLVALADAEFDYTIIKTCNGDSIVFTDLSVGDTVITWTWDFHDGPTSTDVNPSHLFTTTGSYWIVLSITDTSGCFNKDSVLISTYVEAPVAGFTVDPPPYCSGIPIGFQNFSTGQGLTYQWIFGSNTILTDENPIFTFPAAGIFTVYLVVTDSIGCTDTVSANLEINPGPVADFTHFPEALCVGDEIEFSDISAGDPTEYHWDFGNGVTDTSSTSVTLVYNTAGTYTVTLIVDNPFCEPDTLEREIVVSAYPVVDLGIDTAICIGETFLLNAGNPGMRYLWSTGEETQSIIVSIVPQPVDVQVDNNGCLDMDSILVDAACPFYIPTAFTPNGDGTNDLYKIITDGTTQFRFSIFNRWGIMVFSTSDPTEGWDGTYGEQEEEMGAYVYSLQIQFKNGVTRVARGNITLLR
jgi:gliding motility-associated-like protein